MVSPNWLLLNTAEPAGFTFIEDKSPPNAPKAPLMDRYLAVPLRLSTE